MPKIEIHVYLEIDAKIPNRLFHSLKILRNFAASIPRGLPDGLRGTPRNDEENIKDYWMDVYAVNKNTDGESLQVKIWDNVNKEKQDVFFERIQ